ncbi:MAG: hypothetical protein SWH68_03580 [Thermodesulfobacteriota bacterium]|nr:hypothetical protein [Thermodesulfobacteriota bacterium]
MKFFHATCFDNRHRPLFATIRADSWENWEKAIKELKRCINTENPTYIWDAELYDWPEARTILSEIK